MNRRQFTQVLGSTIGGSFLRPSALSGVWTRKLGCHSHTAPTRLRDVNTTNIVDAVTLGCATMSRLFDRDHDNRPYGVILLRPLARLDHDNFSDGHIPGRHLGALLLAEKNMHVALDESAIEKHARTAFGSFSGPIPLPLNRVGADGPMDLFRSEDMGPAIDGLYSLVAFRDSRRAHQIAEACIATCLDLWDPEKGWRRDLIESRGIRYIDPFPESPFIAGMAMALGPLSRYGRLTKSPNAARLVGRLRDRLLDGFFVASGEYDGTRLGSHVHNIVYSLASLAQYATLAADGMAKERVRNFYDIGLKQMSNEIGWSMEFAGPPSPGFFPQSMFPDKGELGNTAKILETALELGRWGEAQYYDDAERIIRGHLLPSQFRDMSFMEDPPNPEGRDERRNVRARIRGAWGYCAPYGLLPYGGGPGRSFMITTSDVVGAVVSALAEASVHTSTFEQNAHRVNLWFDDVTPHLAIQSPYTHRALRLTTKTPGPIHLRVPRWLSETNGTIGARTSPSDRAGYVQLQQPVAGTTTLSLQLASRQLLLTCRDRHIRAIARGDEITAMQNLGANWTFFETIS